MKCNRCGHEGFDPGAGICEHCHIVLYQSDVEAKDKRIAALEADIEKVMAKPRPCDAQRIAALEALIREVVETDDAANAELAKEGFGDAVDRTLTDRLRAAIGGEVDGG